VVAVVCGTPHPTCCPGVSRVVAVKTAGGPGVTSMMCPGSAEPSSCHADVFRPKFGGVLCLVSCPSYALTIAVARNLCPNAVQWLLVQKTALFPEQGLLKLRLSCHHSSFVD